MVLSVKAYPRVPKLIGSLLFGDHDFWSLGVSRNVCFNVSSFNNVLLPCTTYKINYLLIHLVVCECIGEPVEFYC